MIIMANRYNKSKIFKDENGTQYLNRIEYPAIPIRDDDVFIRGQVWLNIYEYRSLEFTIIKILPHNRRSKQSCTFNLHQTRMRISYPTKC